ncbi:hypothetical protein AAFC00_003175 [Neodothiora populina]|uniref:FAD dependent oxidoreductase domain-containing protein n=1 Tax=Neodothiora populina TaxID=2781224 RepID=A0ABR3PA98_9PEZI
MAEKSIPTSILIVGSGVFGLGTAYSLTQNPLFASTKITLLDRLPFPAADAASVDTSRIVRADYADIAYSSLAFEAQEKWRKEWWGQNGIYHEPGLAVICNSADEAGVGNGELGREYMRKSMANVTALGLKPGKKSEGGEVEALESTDDIRRVCGKLAAGSGTTKEKKAHSAIGDFGYVNWRSGWADAEAGLVALLTKVEATKRVTFLHGTVTRLHFSDDSVRGVEAQLAGQESTSKTLTADLVFLATGAWTPALIDTRGVCSATGQVLTYMRITDAEESQLAHNPTILNESSGLFIIPPRKNLLKVARHGYGYANPTTIAHPERPGEEITVSLPRTHISTPDLAVPTEGQVACRKFVSELFPSLAHRPFTHSRICWYTDTAKGDWLITYHPKYKNLFVATGGSGHAYKYLPVIGDNVVQTILGKTPELFRGKWEWPAVRGVEDQVWTEDWRGGRKGMVLDEELRAGLEVKSKL